MIELFTHKQIRCKHCGFGFTFAGFGSAAKMVCPACGEENELPPPVERRQTADGRRQEESVTVSPPALREEETESQERGGVSPPVSPPVPAPCSVEHCPLLTGEESGEAVAEQLGVKFRRKQSRRRAILAWTVTIQLSVLIGLSLFIAQTQIMREWSRVETPVVIAVPPPVHTPVEPKEPVSPPPEHLVLTPEPVAPAFTEPEYSTAWDDIPLDNDPFAILEPGYAVSPHEMSQNAFSEPVMPPGEWDINPFLQETPYSPPPVEQITLTLEMANEFLNEAKDSLATDPEGSAEHAVLAAKIFEHLGHPVPDSLYWILGNAFASLKWGEPLSEASPPVETMALSPNSRHLIVQLQDRSVWLWDLHNAGHPGFPLDSGGAEYVKFLFTPDLRWIIGGQKDGTIRVWDMFLNNPSEAVIMLTERISGLQDLQISPNGQWLAAFGNSPGGVTTAQNLAVHQPIQQVSYQRGDRFGTPDAPYPVLIWNLQQMSSGLIPMAVGIPSMPQPVQVVRFSPHSDRIAVGGRDAIIRVYDFSARGVSEDPFVLRGHQLGITQIAFAPSGQWLATGSQDNTVRLWNLASSKVSTETVVLGGHVGWISALAVSPSGEQVVSGSYDGTMRIWNVKEDQISTALEDVPIVLESNLGVLESFLITSDGDKMIALGNEGSLGIYHFPSLLGGGDFEDFRAIIFRNSQLSISQCLLTLDDQLLIFSYELLPNPSNSGVRLWPL